MLCWIIRYYKIKKFSEIFSKQPNVSWTVGQYKLRQTLCHSRGATGRDVCKVADVAVNEVFALVLAYKDHLEGTLTADGPNIISVETDSSTKNFMTEYED